MLSKIGNPPNVTLIFPVTLTDCVIHDPPATPNTQEPSSFSASILKLVAKESVQPSSLVQDVERILTAKKI